MGSETGRLQLQHHFQLCQGMGLPLTGTVCKLMSRRIESNLIPIYRELANFIEQYGVITVRQFYYHAISIEMCPFPKTAAESGNTYQMIDRVSLNARLYGIIPIDSIADSTDLLGTKQYDDIRLPLTETINKYRSNWWKEQPYYVEVWLEKRALERFFLSLTDYYGVLLSVAGGYPTLAQVYSLKKRLERCEDKEVKVLYFGDLDPSGKDMPKNLRLNKFRTLGINASIDEVALTKEQVQEYNLPRNPTKPKDTRNEAYIREYGINYAVELDALPPEVLTRLVVESIQRYVDLGMLEKCKREDQAVKEEWKRRLS